MRESCLSDGPDWTAPAHVLLFWLLLAVGVVVGGGHTR